MATRTKNEPFDIVEQTATVYNNVREAYTKADLMKQALGDCESKSVDTAMMRNMSCRIIESLDRSINNTNKLYNFVYHGDLIDRKKLIADLKKEYGDTIKTPDGQVEELDKPVSLDEIIDRIEAFKQ